MMTLDVVLIGSGVMSANLGVLLKQLDPALKIELYEVTKELSQESSTGGIMPALVMPVFVRWRTLDRGENGEIKVDKAIEIFEEFEQTKQFWAYAVREGMIDKPSEFINQVPHISFVYGQEQVDFLRSRYKGMSNHPFFETMQYSEDPEQIRKWAPLLIEGFEDQPVAATYMEAGTDVNFGEVSRKLILVGRTGRMFFSRGDPRNRP